MPFACCKFSHPFDCERKGVESLSSHLNDYINFQFTIKINVQMKKHREFNLKLFLSQNTSLSSYRANFVFCCGLLLFRLISLKISLIYHKTLLTSYFLLVLLTGITALNVAKNSENISKILPQLRNIENE